MRITLLQVFNVLNFVLCWAFVTAYDLTTRRTPLGPLGITLDYSLAVSGPTPPPPPGQRQDARSWQFSSLLTFNGDVSTITDGQLVQMARDAWQEVNNDLAQYMIRRMQHPAAMTALAFGNNIILASSQKGQTSYTYEQHNTEVRNALELCQTIWMANSPTNADIQHENDGRCGEVMAAHMYYRRFANQGRLPTRNARIVTVIVAANGDLPIRPPCGDPTLDIWGCNLFVQNQQLHEVPDNTGAESYVLSSIAGGLVGTGQIRLCE